MQKVVKTDQLNNILDLKESFFRLTVGAIVRLRTMKNNSITSNLYDKTIEQISNACRDYASAENSASPETFFKKIDLVYEQLNETVFCLRLAKLMVINSYLQTALDQLIEKTEELMELSFMMKNNSG